MINWWAARIIKLPSDSRPKVVKFLAKDLESHPLTKPPPDVDDATWYHLLVDIFKGKNLDSQKTITTFFEELIKAINMKPLSDLLIKYVNNEFGRGTSALQLISGSSITFHSDYRFHNAFIDVFSCLPFAGNLVVSLVKKHFEPETINTNFIYREEK